MPKRRQTRAPARSRSGGQRPRGTTVGRAGSPAGRPVPAGQLYTPGASAARQAVERSSARPVMFLRQLPRWAPGLAVLLLIPGFAVPGWIGGATLALVAIFLTWLAYLSWPSINTSGRVMRAAAIVCIALLAVWQTSR